MSETVGKSEYKAKDEFKRTAFSINSLMFIFHAIFLIVFYLLKVKELVYINIGSLIIYAINFFVIKKHHVKTFLTLLLFEIWVHLYATTICCGWDFGFALYPFAMISVIFYTKYIFNDQSFIKVIQPVICVTSILFFMILRVFTYIYDKPLYSFNPIVSKIFYSFNAIAVFTFMIVFLLWYTSNVLKSEKSLHEIADYDELTELFNRHKMRDVLSKVYNDAESNKSINFCTAIIDIDDFKIVNDTYGHDAGDYILQSVSSIMRRICKESPNTYIGRWGGEEFLIVQEYTREINEGVVPCINTIKKIHDTIKTYEFNYGGHNIVVTVTGGLAARQADASIAATIRLADERLYKGKLNGKDCISFG